MDSVLLGMIGIIFFLLLIALGVHLSTNFFIVGFLTMLILLGLKPALTLIGSTMYYSIASPSFAALPLYILLGAVAARGGLAGKAYKFVYILASKLPGSLAIATSYGCAFFGAICGSAMATAAVFGKVALPEMLKYKYDKSLALGTIASSGTFAAMIPPSTALIVYAFFTDVSIGRLFLAGIIPGFLTATVYSLLIIFRVKLNPKLAPKVIGEEFSIKDKMKAIKDTWPIVLLIIIVLGGIFSGIFTPTEAAAVGTLAALIIGIFQRKLNLNVIKESVRDAAQTSSMIFIIIIGALFFSRFVAVSQFADRIAYSIQAWGLRRELVLLGVLVLWFFLGMIIEGTGIRAIVLPIFFPLIVSMGYDPIWFGILTLKLGEIGAVTPPMATNVFVLKAAVGEGISIEEIFKGILPFILCDVIVLIFMVAFPNIVLYLPNLVLGK
ncbi:C4-dicarboxylate TRAP transporter large permease protein DctM [subsurface metagenome]